MKDRKGPPNREYPTAFSDYVNKFEELKTVFENFPEGIAGILDGDSNIATANKAFSKMLKLPLNNIVGQNATKLFRKNVPDLIEILKETMLLGVLQEKIVEPLGSSGRIPVDVRILSATNRDAIELVAKGILREELYYLLKVILINLPALREKKTISPI